MKNDFYDIVGEFRNNPMLAWEFLDIHDSFPIWKKALIRIRFLLRRSLGI